MSRPIYYDKSDAEIMEDLNRPCVECGRPTGACRAKLDLERKYREESYRYGAALVRIAHGNMDGREAKLEAVKALGWKRWGYGENEQRIEDLECA